MQQKGIVLRRQIRGWICQHLLHDRSAHELCIRLVNTILVIEAVEVRLVDRRLFEPAARRTNTMMRTEIRGE